MPAVKRLFSFAGLLLLAAWLPATQHCGLEAAGWLPETDVCHQDQHADQAHSSENCSLIEEGAYQSFSFGLKVAEPAAPCACLLQLTFLSEVRLPLFEAPAVYPPPDLPVCWRFLTRAAPPARAPSLNLARA